MTKSICLFNHKGGVSKTTTTFHLGWGLAERGHKVMMVDLDSQCNLTGIIMGLKAIDYDKMEEFYSNQDNITMKSVAEAVISGSSPIEFLRTNKSQLLATNCKNLLLLPGHLDISNLDSQINVALKIAHGLPAMKNIPGNLPMMLQEIAKKEKIDYVIYDLSPNVGGLNEVILMSSDYFIVPTSPDYFCLQAIGSLGKNITKWHREIKRFKEENNFDSEPFSIKNTPQFLGVIQQRYRPRNERPAVSFDRWISKIQAAIESELVPALSQINCLTNADKLKGLPNKEELKPYELAHVPDFNSLIPISQQLGKPVFALSPGDLTLRGIAKKNTVKSIENFREIFTNVITRIETLTK